MSKLLRFVKYNLIEPSIRFLRVCVLLRIAIAIAIALIWKTQFFS